MNMKVGIKNYEILFLIFSSFNDYKNIVCINICYIMLYCSSVMSHTPNIIIV